MMDRRLLALSGQDTTAQRFDRVLEGLVIGLLAFMPLALGAVQAWSEQVVLTLAAAIGLVFLLKLLWCRETVLVWSWAYVPVTVFVLVALLQLVPLPSGLVGVLSPQTAAVKRALLHDLPEADRVLSTMTLTFYPYATRHDLRLVVAVAAVFVVVVNIYRQSEQIKRLLAAIAAIGGGIALLALVQDVAGNGKIYWWIPTYDQAFSGTFINHSHYGQFMNLSLGAALGLLLVELYEAFGGRRVAPARVVEYLGSARAKTVKLLAAMLVLGMATTFLSLTRGGMVSMLLAAVFTTVVLGSRRSLAGHGWIIVLLALVAFVCVLYVGFDQVYDRLATLRQIDQAEGGRWQMTKDIVGAWAKFPLFGVGLGTHQVVYPMFDRSTSTGWATHAENEYAQLAEETGLVGLAALVVFGVLIWVHYGRSVAQAHYPIRAAAYGLGFGLLAILVHSLSDFGQHLPANALLSAVCCALLIVLAGVDRREEDKNAGRKEPRLSLSSYYLPVAGRALVLALAAGVWLGVLLGANRARVAEAHWQRALAAEQHLEAHGARGDEDQAYRYLISQTAAAAAARPDNIQYRHWVNIYRWRSLERHIDPNSGQLPAEALPFVRQIVDEWHACRPVCPTFGAAYCVAGEIAQFILHDPNGAEDIRRGYQLAPCDPAVCFAAARLAAQAGQADSALEKLHRLVLLDGRYFQRAAILCLDSLQRADWAVELAGDDTGRLAYVSNLLAARDKPQAAPGGGPGAIDLPAGRNSHRQLIEQTQTKAFEELKRKCEQPEAPAWAHASLADQYRRAGDLEAATGHYRRALVKDYDQVDWHYALAQLLVQVDRAEEAAHEARICLRLRPDYTPAQKLVRQLSAVPKAVPPPAGGR